MDLYSLSQAYDDAIERLYKDLWVLCNQSGNARWAKTKNIEAVIDISPRPITLAHANSLALLLEQEYGVSAVFLQNAIRLCQNS